MRGVYTAHIQVTVTAAKTVLYLTAPADKVIEILSASITNVDNDTNEQFECALERVTTHGSAAGTAVTPRPTEEGDQAAATTVLGNLTVEPTTYSGVQFGREGAASLGGWFFDPVPEERVYVRGQQRIGLRMLTAIASTLINANVRFREIG